MATVYLLVGSIKQWIKCPYSRRSLEAEKRSRDIVLKRKQEEVVALRKVARGDMSRKAAGRLPPKISSSSPRLAKQKWAALQKNINAESFYKQQTANMELELDR